MRRRSIDIKGLSEKAALELLCRELNLLRDELSRATSKIDSNTVIFPDGRTLEEYLNEKE